MPFILTRIAYLVVYLVVYLWLPGCYNSFGLIFVLKCEVELFCINQHHKRSDVLCVQASRLIFVCPLADHRLSLIYVK